MCGARRWILERALKFGATHVCDPVEAATAAAAGVTAGATPKKVIVTVGKEAPFQESVNETLVQAETSKGSRWPVVIDGNVYDDVEQLRGHVRHFRIVGRRPAG